MSFRTDARVALFTAVLAVTTLTLHAGEAHAQATPSTADKPATAERDARARDLFRHGKDAAARKQWLQAYSLFQESYELSPAHDTAHNLGHVALKLQRAADAARYLSIALKSFPQSGDKKRRADLEHYVELALRHVTRLRLELTPADAEVTVDRQNLGTVSAIMNLQGGLFLEPGRHTVEVKARGYEPRTESVIAEPGMDRALTLSLDPNPATSATSSAATAPSSTSAAPPTTSGDDYAPTPPPANAELNGGTRKNILPPVVVGGGIALAALGIGIGFTIASSSAESNADDLERSLGDDASCGPGTPFTERCADLRAERESADSSRNIATAAFIGAGVAAVGTAAYVLWLSSRNDRAAPARLVPHVAASASSASFALRGAF